MFETATRIEQVEMTEQFNEGLSSLALQYSSVPDLDQLYNGSATRFYIDPEKTVEGYYPAYIHYIQEVEGKNVQFPMGITSTTKEETKELNLLLQKECAGRMSFEFAPDSTDESWYGLGDVYFAYRDGNKIVGYCSAEMEKDIVHLWTVYVSPEYRGKGIYSKFLDAVTSYGVSKGARHIILATDATEANAMHSILRHKGFKSFRKSMRNFI